MLMHILFVFNCSFFALAIYIFVLPQWLWQSTLQVDEPASFQRPARITNDVKNLCDSSKKMHLTKRHN